MKIGWVDFSKKDRDAALEAIRNLRGQGAVDELGVGPIRDAFADAFFPGTSTLQTRAKYFLLVPYVILDVLKECDKAGTFHVHEIKDEITNREHKIAKQLFDKDPPETDGLIGVTRLRDNNWVLRGPSVLYWSGIREYGIFTRDQSLDAFISEWAERRRDSDDVLLDNKIDKFDSAGGRGLSANILFDAFNVGGCYVHGWDKKDRLHLSLLKDEAEFLARKITKSETTKGSLMAFVIRKPQTYERYRALCGGVDARQSTESDSSLWDEFCDSIKSDSDLDASIKILLGLSRDFNKLVYAARVLYNKMLGNGDAQNLWKRIEANLQDYARVDMNAVFERLRVKDRHLQRYKFFILLADAFRHRNINEAEKLIQGQEIRLKQKSRAKLNDPSSVSRDKWIGGKWLDYRLPDAMRIVGDIVKGREAANV